ncbi:hypothetical protein BH10PSE4_BH10PSE4_03100 [soil metagenome]
MTTDPAPDLPIAFRRSLDGLVYRFAPADTSHDRPRWRRTDLDLDLHWVGSHGWVVTDPAGTVLSRPWDVEPCDQGPLPPQGVWVSRKGDKAYVYELVYHRASEA